MSVTAPYKNCWMTFAVRRFSVHLHQILIATLGLVCLCDGHEVIARNYRSDLGKCERRGQSGSSPNLPPYGLAKEASLQKTNDSSYHFETAQVVGGGGSDRSVARGPPSSVATGTLKASAECPHGNFVMKHLCSWCASNQDALEFSKERNARGSRFRTNVNSVLFGSPSFESDGNYCFSDDAKIVTCTLNSGNCVLNGNRCRSYHSLENGHLYYGDIQCR